MDINAKIEKLKNERGWSDYELSQQAMVTQSTIASMKARKSPPKLDTLQAICNAFGITLAQFFLEDEQVEVLSKQEKILLENFRKLPEKKQKALLDLL
ncbi:MAG: helix-turn-helix domain-containing protein [Candidatus Fimimonas sp.]